MAKRGNPNWIKGQTGNPNGRPKTGVAELEQLRAAIKRVSKKEGKDLFTHFVERAYENDGVLAALMKKIIADMKHIEADITVETYEERVKRMLGLMEDNL